jgi:FAD/FMN-containing dehydrogenase
MYLDVTAAGAASTGAHGSSLRHGSFSDSVVAVRLVAAGGGRAQWLREAQSECGRSDWRAEELAQGTAPLATLPDALAAARVGCGALGVVCALELCAVPLYRVRRRASRLPLLASREAAANLVAHARAHEHAWAHWRLGEADALVTVLEREPTDEGSPAAACAEGRAPALGEAPGAEGAPAEFAPYDGANWFRKGGGAALPAEPSAAATAEATVDAAPRAAAPVWISSEYGVPVSRMHEAACALDRALARSHRGQLIELKFVAAGAAARESLLGPNGGAREDICCFNVWWHSTAQPPQLAALPFERAMQALGATPHWGKLHTLPDGYVDRVLGERARRFRAVARALDPARMCAPGWC